MILQTEDLEAYVLSLGGGLLVLSLAGFLAWLSTVIYSIYFHPLSRFPGPRSAAASYLPYSFHLVEGTFTTWVKELHDRYKCDVIRIGPNHLSFISPSAWKDILGGSGSRSFEKDVAVYGRSPNGVESLLQAPRADHSRMRRVLDHAFSMKAVRQQDPIILQTVNTLIGGLKDQVSGDAVGKVDLVRWYSWMSFDLIGDLAFGESFHCLEDKGNHPWVQMIFGNLKGFVFMNACSRFPAFASILPWLIPPSVKRMIDDHFKQTQDKLSRRIAKGASRSDFLTPILENNSAKALTKDEIDSNASLFIIAGSDSVGTSVAGATWYLLENPKVMDRLRREIDETFSKEEDITTQSVDGLPYLCAVVQELFRIYPVALAGQASVVPHEGAVISGHWIPGKTGVSMNQFAVYRSKTNFQDPDVFDPERWLDEPEYGWDRKDAFHPFSIGPRNCIGRNLGLAATRLVLAKMVWHFDMKLSGETDPNWLHQKSYIVWQKKPLLVELAPRASAKAKKEDNGIALKKEGGKAGLTDAEVMPAPAVTNTPVIEGKREDGIPEATTETVLGSALENRRSEVKNGKAL